MEIGPKIKRLRTQLGLTQEELGAKVGVQKAAIYKYENGLVVNLKRSILEKLALVLDTTPTYLMGMEDAEPAQASLTKAQTSLLSVFDKLNEEGQAKVIEYAEDLHRTGYYKKPAADGLVTKEA